MWEDKFWLLKQAIARRDTRFGAISPAVSTAAVAAGVMMSKHKEAVVNEHVAIGRMGASLRRPAASHVILWRLHLLSPGVSLSLTRDKALCLRELGSSLCPLTRMH